MLDGSEIFSLSTAGADWQIFRRRPNGTVLLATEALARRWCEVGLLDDGALGVISFGDSSYRSLQADATRTLVAVESAHSPDNKVDALAFAVALRESRAICREASFHDALYVEQYSRLLPTWTLTPTVEDEVVLGRWLTGGVVVSTDSFRRLSTLAGWMPASDLVEVVAAAGLSVPTHARALVKSRRDSERRSEREAGQPKTKEQQQDREIVEGRDPARVFTLPGRPQLEAFFNEHVIDIVLNADRYRALGIEFPSAIVLHGPSGCGKTFAVERLVEFLDWPSFSINSNSVGSPYIHETSKKVSDLFDKAIDAAPSILVIDEMESFLTDRRSGGVSGLHHVEEVAEFLRRIPEAISRRVLIIAMTNLLEMIDPAILRRGRFDHVIEVGMPAEDEVRSLLVALLGSLPNTQRLKVDGIARILAGRPLSDAAFVVREAARLAARNSKVAVDQESIEEAVAKLPAMETSKARQIGFGRDR